jgi:PTH1 family peptidyl-tRNA hydrolase
MSGEFSLVVGLGNPGSRYTSTRHNIGFAVVDALRFCSGVSDLGDLRGVALSKAADALAGRYDREGWFDKGDYLESSVVVGGWKPSLLKPQTFMNRSGEPTRGYLQFKKTPLSHIIVVHDEIDLPFGTVRLKFDGGEGGHNGLRSISDCCGGRGYTRVRVGVGKPAAGSPLAGAADGVATWVLSRFTAEELPHAEDLVARAAEAVVSLGLKGFRLTQDRYHR